LRDIYWILLLAAAAFGGSLTAPFHLDDFALLSDPLITDPHLFAHAAEWLRQTRPLTWLTFWVNYQLGGSDPFGYHLVNLLLHLASIVLLRDTLGRITSPATATLATVVFALHPIQTEAVSYVFARATLLMALFCIVALRAWLGGRHWQAVVWFVPALLAKEECVSFPLLLGLLHLVSSRNPRERAPIAVLLLLAVAAGLRVLAATSAVAGSGAGVQAGVGPVDYFVAQGVAIWRYVRLLAIPWGFSIESPVVVSPWGWLGWLALGGVVVWSLGRFDKARVGFWVLGALVLLAPSSTLLPAADLSADRRVYLPLAIGGVAIAMALGRAFGGRVVYALAGVLAVLSMVQTARWRDGEQLWRQAVAAAPHQVRPRIQLARQVREPGVALAVLEEARVLAPDDPAIASEKGKVLLESGNPQAALAEFGRALALTPNDARALNNRGVALSRMGQKDAAIADFQRALAVDACLFDARFNLRSLGVALPQSPDCGYTPEQRMQLGGR
jgi:hypothetical protein